MIFDTSSNNSAEKIRQRKKIRNIVAQSNHFFSRTYLKSQFAFSQELIAFCYKIADYLDNSDGFICSAFSFCYLQKLYSRLSTTRISNSSKPVYKFFKFDKYSTHQK